MNRYIISSGIVLAAAALLVGGALAAQRSDPPWVGGEDNRMAPAETQAVVDSAGAVVGVVMTADLDGDGVYHPVYSLDDHTQHVGWIGEHGYWAVGEPKAWCLDCISTVESIDTNGQKHVVTETYGADYTITRTTQTTDSDGNVNTTVETIIEGADDPPGPTGSVNN